MFRYGSPSHSRAGRGFPIRTSWDQSSVINSPRLIADSHVLLRLLMPRHPPCALKNLTITHTTHHHPKGDDGYMRTQNFKMLASTMQFSNNNPSNTPPAPHTRNRQPCPGTPETPKTRPHRKTHTNRANHPTRPSPCCLRTQQCAKRYRTTTNQPFPKPHTHHQDKPGSNACNPYSNQPAPTRHLFIDIPPMSTHRRTNACAMGILLTTPSHPIQDNQKIVGAP